MQRERSGLAGGGTHGTGSTPVSRSLPTPLQAADFAIVSLPECPDDDDCDRRTDGRAPQGAAGQSRSSDYSSLSDSRQETPALSELRGRLLEWKARGAARFAFSGARLSEMAPVGGRHPSAAASRADLLVDLCDPNAPQDVSLLLELARRRNRASSSRSALLSTSLPRAGLPASAAARATQAVMFCALTLNSRDSSAGERPTIANSAIGCLNASGYGGLVWASRTPSLVTVRCPRKWVNFSHQLLRTRQAQAQLVRDLLGAAACGQQTRHVVEPLRAG